jgi:soluble lytic murein transglycosylase-like protein
MTETDDFSQGLRAFAKSVAQGFFAITHNSFALIGLAVMFAAITLTARPALRQASEVQLYAWLQDRQSALQGMVTAAPLTELSAPPNPRDVARQQAAVTHWLGRKYSIAAEPLGALVAAAYETGVQAKLDPTLILAIMAIESGFNPFAQSANGAQGLMQVMTRVHGDKYQEVGGKLAAFDPVANMQVGVKVLQECIARAGSLEGGLKFYVGAANREDDNGYAAKVLAEHSRLQQVAAGRAVPLSSPAATPAKALPAAESVASIANS